MPTRKKKSSQPPRQIELAPDVVHIFTDGSSSRVVRGGKGPGGWGAVLIYNQHYKEIYGGQPATTNNEMELSGIYEGLRALKRKDRRVVVYSDSQYAINAVSVWWRGWRRRGWCTANGTPVKNLDLIKAIVELVHDNVSFRWVKGHNGLKYNERADVLAGKGKRQYGKSHRKRGTPEAGRGEQYIAGDTGQADGA